MMELRFRGNLRRQGDASRELAWRLGVLPAVLMVFVLANLASCGKSDQSGDSKKGDVVQPLAPQENLAASSTGARAIATSSEGEHFPVAHLNDGTAAPWGAAAGQNDVYAAVVLHNPRPIQEFRIWLFSPEQPPRPHLRDIRVLIADSEAVNGPNWRVVRSRLSKDQPFTEKVTVPPLGDNTVVLVEIDRNDPNWGPHKIWGFGCFSASHGDARNYLPTGTGVYVRELQMK